MRATVHTTAFDGAREQSPETNPSPSADTGGRGTGLVNLYPEMGYLGGLSFGHHRRWAPFWRKRMPPERPREVIDACFRTQGLGYRAIRPAYRRLCHWPESTPPSPTRGDKSLRTFSLARRDEQRILDPCGL